MTLTHRAFTRFSLRLLSHHTIFSRMTSHIKLKTMIRILNGLLSRNTIRRPRTTNQITSNTTHHRTSKPTGSMTTRRPRHLKLLRNRRTTTSSGIITLLRHNRRQNSVLQLILAINIRLRNTIMTILHNGTRPNLRHTHRPRVSQRIGRPVTINATGHHNFITTTIISSRMVVL